MNRFLFVCCVISMPFGVSMAQPARPMVRASHIMIRIDVEMEEAFARLAKIKKSIDEDVTKALASLPDTTTKEEREKSRVAFMKRAFADAAKKHSDCPSKTQQGNIGLFPRKGVVVEPFAKAAFEATPFEITGPVVTEFGYHLILVTERK